MEFDFSRTIRNLFNEAIVNRRFINHGLSPKMVNELSRWVPLEVVDLSAKKEKKADDFSTFLVPFFFMFLMFFGIFGISQHLLMSVIEEKSSRVIEVLLTSVSPFRLMAGKILGQCAVGLTLVVIYGTASYITASLRGMSNLLSPVMMIYFILYFLPGFLLFSSLLAAIGSACNSHKEAQNLMVPLMLVAMVPMMLWFNLVQHPESTLAVVLSFIPPMTPMVMILRLAARPDLPLFQVIASFLLLLLSVPAFMWAAAKIFRTGILMYGKPPGVREILRWLRSD
jgi:ABC-2 type transport system permease protein